jgi:mRNA interferase MazF
MKKMTPSNLIVDQRDIVWLEITFSDLSDSKIRPGLILSNDSYNKTHLDVICCGLTSRKPKDYYIPINNTDIESGKPFTKDNHVRYDWILKVDKKLIRSKHGRLKKPKTQEIIDAIQRLIKIE